MTNAETVVRRADPDANAVERLDMEAVVALVPPKESALASRGDQVDGSGLQESRRRLSQTARPERRPTRPKVPVGDGAFRQHGDAAEPNRALDDRALAPAAG